MTIKVYKNISSIIDYYDLFIVDLWGVIYDGTFLYDNSLDCLKKLSANNKEVIFLSNAPRRAHKARDRLKELGIDNALYSAIVTSGEVVHSYIKKNGKDLGNNYYIIGPERDNDIIEDLNYNYVSSSADADFVIITGFDDNKFEMDYIIPELDIAIKRNLTLICANPDMMIVKKNGNSEPCAGYIGNYYQKMGGKVIYFGKPYPAVYEEKILSMISTYDISRVAAIGDSLETDIKGATNFNIDSYLITGGILTKELDASYGEIPNESQLEKIFKKYNIYPKAVIPTFSWE